MSLCGIHVISYSHDTVMDPSQLMGIQNRQAQFRWAPIDFCTPVHYAITTNCSTQRSAMTTDQATTNFPVSESTTVVVEVSDFSVQNVVYDNLMGNLHTAVVTLQGK